MFAKGRANDKGFGLSFVSPLIQEGSCVANVDVEEVNQMVEIWDRALTFYVIGASPSIGAVVRFCEDAWKDIAKPKIQLHDKGYFVILFQSMSDCNKVLDAGLYTMWGKPVLLKKWS